MAPIHTYVFLEIKPIDVRAEEFNKTKITELSFVAVKRSHILEPSPGDSPRVQQKLTLHLIPPTEQPDSTKFAGRSNNLLEQDFLFSESVFDTINNFIIFLSKPVCLVSTGITNNLEMVKKLNNLSISFPHDLLCANCVHYFYDVDTKLVDMISNARVENTCQTIIDEQHSILNQEIKDIQQQNESTPKKSGHTSLNKHNIPIKRKSNAYPKAVSKIRRRISFGDEIKPQTSYKLKDIYNGYNDDDKNIQALKWAMVKSEQFVQFVDNNHYQFADV